MTTRACSTSHPTSPRSTKRFGPAAERTDLSVVIPGSCLSSSSAGQPCSFDASGVIINACFSHALNLTSAPVCLQEELVPPRSGSVSELSGGVQPAVQRRDELGNDQDDIQCERSGAANRGLRFWGSKEVPSDSRRSKPKTWTRCKSEN